MYSMASIGYSLKCVRLVSVLSDLVLFLKFLYIGVIYMLQDFKKIDDFYPTPDFLIDKMLEKVNLSKVKYILEPSAGKGNIIEKLKDKIYHRTEINAIEINPELQSVLRGEGYQVIDTDFLSHMGGEMYDLIIANPPFSEGEHHLLG